MPRDVFDENDYGLGASPESSGIIEGGNVLEGFDPGIKESGSKGPIAGLFSGLYKGAKYGVPEQVAKASQFLGLGGEEPGDIAQRVSEWGRAGLGDEKVGMTEEAGRMIPQSVGIPMFLTGAGKALTLWKHPYAMAAGVALQGLGKIATYATPAIFGLSQAQQTRETARERGVEEGMAPQATGLVEMAGETIGNIALLKMLGPLGKIGNALRGGAKGALKGTVYDLLKRLALVTMPTEIGTEMGQAYLQGLIEQRADIRPEADPWAEAMDVIGPTAIMTAIMGGGGGVLGRHVAARQADLLATPINTTNPEAPDYVEQGSEEYTRMVKDRLDIASNVGQLIPKENQPLRDQWLAYADDQIRNNRAIDVESPLDTLGMAINQQMQQMPEEYDAVAGEYAGMNWGGVAGAGLGFGGEAGLDKQTVSPGRIAPGFGDARAGIATPGQVAAAQDVYGRKLPAAMAQMEAAGAIPVEPVAPGAATGAGGIGPAPNIPMAPTVEAQGALDLTAPAPVAPKKAAKKKAPAKVATGLGLGGKTPAAKEEEEPYISGVGTGAGGLGAEWVGASPAAKPGKKAKAPTAAPEERKPLVETPVPAVNTVKITDAKAAEHGLETAVVSAPTIVKHANGKFYVKNPDGSYTVNPANKTIFFEKRKDATATFQASGKATPAPVAPAAPDDVARNKYNLAKAAYENAAKVSEKWGGIIASIQGKKITLKSLAQEFGGKVPTREAIIAKAQEVNDELAKKRSAMEALAPKGEKVPAEKKAQEVKAPEAKEEEAEPEGGVDTAVIAANISRMKDSELLSKTPKELWRDARVARPIAPEERAEAKKVLKAHEGNPAKYLKARIDKAKTPVDKYARIPDNNLITLAKTGSEGAVAEATRRGLKFSATGPGVRPGISTSAATVLKDKIVASIKNCPKINLLENPDGLPQWIKGYAAEQDVPLSTVDGVYDERTGEVYVVLGNVRTTRQLVRVILHELTHKGLAGFFARHKGTPGLGSVNLAYDIFMDKTYQANTNAIKAVVFSTHGHIDLSTKKGQRAAAEEWIANQTYRLQPRLYDRLVAIYKDVIRQLGLDKYLGDISDSEIRILVHDSFKEFGLRPSDHAQGGKFSRSIDKGSRILREGGLSGRRTIAQIAALLQRRTPIDHANATARQNHEVELKLLEFLDTCIDKLPRAVGWYRRDFSKAMSILERLDPSILTPEGNLMMRGAIALASNGNKTDPTIEVAYSAYKNWRETGEFVPTFTGARHDVNVTNMQFFQALYKTFNSPAAYQKWLLEMQPAGDTINEVARRLQGIEVKISGENADAIVPRAVIFGPKLGAFFCNLSGFYDPITMDRWYMRTIGRITGTIFKDIDIDKARTRLRNALTPEIYKIVTGDELGLRRTINELTDDEIDGIALRIKRSAYEKLEGVYEDARTAGNHLGKALEGELRDAPISGSQRIWIRERMANVRKMRPQYELSDIQAAMWIGEKEIFKLMGGRFQDADFYSEGAENLASKLAGEDKLLRRSGRAARRVRQAAAEAEGSALFSRTRTEKARGIIDQIVATAKANPDGFTIEIADGTLVPKGFAVAPSKLTETRLDKLYDSDISEFIDDFAEVFDSDERAMLGGWYNSQTGKFILDVSYVVDKLEDALYIAELGSQDAIFDIFDVKEVRTKDGISGLKQAGVYSEAKRDGLRDLQESVHRALQASGNAIWGGAAFSRTGEEAGRAVGEGPEGPGGVRQGFEPTTGKSYIKEGVHYSKEIRTVLDSTAYGTGMPDAARLRLPGDRTSPLYQRIHIYTPIPRGIRPESGVGGFRHDVDLSQYNIYDIGSGIIRVDRVEGENIYNTFELEVMRRGFDGHRNPESGHVVLLGPRKIPVKYAPGPLDDLGAKFHLIGLNGVSAFPQQEREIARNNYRVAFQMAEDKGLARYTDESKDDWDKIFVATGWMRGPDSRWRYEIDDSAMKILPAFDKLPESLLKETTIPLTSAIDYPLLFKAYPELRNAEVIKFAPLYDKAREMQGWWDEPNNRLGVTPYAHAYRLTLVHEIQHAIQAREGFARGGAPDPSLAQKAPQALINRLAQEGIAAMQQHINDLKSKLVQVQEIRAAIVALSPWKKSEFNKIAEKAKDYDTEIKKLAIRWAAGQRDADLNDNANGFVGTNAIVDIERKKIELIQKRQALIDPSLPPLVPTMSSDEIIQETTSHEVRYLGLISSGKKMETILATGNDQEVRALIGAVVPVDLYQAISGEVESRATEKRAIMSGQTRKTTPVAFDIPEAQQINLGPAISRGAFTSPTVPMPSMVVGNGQGELLPAAPKFSTTGAEAATSFPIPVKTLGNDLYYTFIDKMTDLRRVVAAIRNLGRTIREEVDASLRETLFSGRVAKRIEDVYEKELVPIYKKIGDYGLTKDEVEEYLHNRHAREANAYIRSLTDDNGTQVGMQDAGSGISDQQAEDYLNSVQPAKRLKLEAVAKMIDDFTRKSAHTLVEYGLETQDTIDQWFRKYQHYVPLFRDHVIDGNIGVGTGYSIHGQSSKQRKGSESKVVNILANIVHQRERIIVRGEKNILAKALWGLMKANPNPAFWKAAKPWIRKATDIESGEQVKVPDFHYKWADNVIMHRAIEQGKVVEHGVELNDNDPTALRMAQAMKNIDMDTLGLVLGASAKVTRFIAAMNTQYNPVFGITNFVRDTGTALLNLTTTPISGKQKQVMNYSLKALAGIYSAMRAHRTGKEVEGEWGKLFEEFQQVGGQTGYRDLFKTMYDRSKSIEMEIKELQAGKILKGGYAIRNLLSDYNTAMENALRLSAYKVGVESGMSKDAAAAMAKGLTVNFNRKGQISTQAGALYAFFNASAQGAAKVAETLMGPAGRKVIQGGLVLGALQAMMLAAAGFGDDEPPEFVQEKNIIIPIGGKDYITIPMPLGFNVLPNIGRVTTQFALGGFDRPFKRMGDLVGVIMDGFNPLGASQSLLQTISPTPIDPLVALAENKDWTGQPIYREDYSSLHPTPGFTRTKDSATFMGKGLSWGINMLSGGTRYTPGLFSPTADQIDFLAGQFTGGVGRESAKIIQTGQTIATGEELPTWKRPVLSRFYGSAEGKAVESTRFYENIRKLNLHEEEIKGRIKDRQPVAEYLKDNPEARLWKLANNAENSVKKLRERKSLLISRKASKESIKTIDTIIERKMRQLNEQVAAMKG